MKSLEWPSISERDRVDKRRVSLHLNMQWRRMGGTELLLHSPLKLLLNGGKLSALPPGHFTRKWKSSDTHWTGGERGRRPAWTFRKRKICCHCRKGNPVSPSLGSFLSSNASNWSCNTFWRYWLLTRVINRGSVLGKWRYFPNERGILLISDVCYSWALCPLRWDVAAAFVFDIGDWYLCMIGVYKPQIKLYQFH